MKITIVTVGTRGDVEPLVALGQGLKEAGHTIKLATHAMFESFVTGNGLQFALISGNVQEAINSDEGRQVLEKSKSTLSFIHEIRQKAAPLVLAAVKEVQEACKGADHIVCTPITLYISYFTAQELAIPFSVGCVNPAGPTRYFHNVLTQPAALWLPDFARKIYNVATHVIIGKMVWLGQRPLLSSAWKEVYGHKLPYGEPLAAAFRKSPPLMLYAYSKYVLPKPADWASIQHVTGYWFLKSHPTLQLQPQLEQFIKAGPKPIYIGFGSMNSDKYKHGQVKTMILETIKKTGRRAVVLNAGLGLVQSELPENIFATDALPFQYLFPKMAAVVHHGGAGTTAAGLRDGVPSVITPLIYDQRFWSWCVQNIGAGTKPIEWTELNSDNLSAAIKTALVSNDINSKAHETGIKIRAENGVEEAVKLINQFYFK